ncbi:MAG: hypothetical protein AAF581_09505 [Planctomycetota bacterium]
MNEARTADLTLFNAFTQELTAYQQELRLYPAGHPRLEARLAALLSAVEAMARSGGGTLLLEVTGARLSCNDAPVDATHQGARRIVQLFRERMLQKCSIKTGVGSEEMLQFADLLSSAPQITVIEDNKVVQFGPHVELTYFNRKFGSSGQGDGPSAVGQVRFDDPEWRNFDEDQLSSIVEVLARPSVQGKIQELSDTLTGSASDCSFSARFFGVLNGDPRTDWDNRQSLEDMVLTGLELLERAEEEKQNNNALPTQLLAAAGDQADELSTNLRWKLLRNFFRGTLQDSSPRDVEDLSFRDDAEEKKESKPSTWTVTEAPEKAGETRPEEMAAEFVEDFENMHCVSQYAHIVGDLCRAHEADVDDDLVEASVGTLNRELPQRVMTAAEVRALFKEISGVPVPLQLAWQAEVLTTRVLAEDVLAAATGGQGIQQAVLENPGQILVINSDPTTPVDWSAEVLRRFLSRDGERPLEALLVILSADLTPSVRTEWIAIASAAAARNPALGAWIDANVQRLVEADAHALLWSLPERAVQRFSKRLTPAQKQQFVRNLAPKSPAAATTVLATLLGADLVHVRLGAIRALGRQSDEHSVQLLQEMLTEQSTAKEDSEEVAVLCQALSQRPDGGIQFLEKVVSEKGRWFGRGWSRGVRRTARRSLLLRESGRNR